MHGPATSLPASVSAWLLVLLCAASGAYCLVRAGRAGRGGRGAAAGEALMGFGMAVMAAPTGLGTWGPPILLAVFCAAALHALWLLHEGVHHTHHLVGSLAMAYMALTMTVPGTTASTTATGYGTAGGHGAGLPLLTGALLLYFAGYVLLGGARLVAAGGGAQPLTGPVGSDAPLKSAELTRACRLAMGIGMLAMLLTM
ncbi:DUF5134 domain-containing protein [Streptomyces sp. NBC_01408]|uniref:DUF5134 domain-containing protein n=1 Tax=Streptomyces sp. NBC_01408 TaxID=2903855 RepID=UPI0022501108|nr:DUF5134 domain-containing protein [Streptomyces sp. NBC_01408]MCX4694875.1 DUF5134 domain-containing protein [Streptomyces sp. NBC_01408]